MTSGVWPRFGFLSESDEEEESQTSAADSEGGWIQWFCRLEGHEFFCEVRGLTLSGLCVLHCHLAYLRVNFPTSSVLFRSMKSTFVTRLIFMV